MVETNFLALHLDRSPKCREGPSDLPDGYVPSSMHEGECKCPQNEHKIQCSLHIGGCSVFYSGKSACSAAVQCTTEYVGLDLEKDSPRPSSSQSETESYLPPSERKWGTKARITSSYKCTYKIQIHRSYLSTSLLFCY